MTSSLSKFIPHFRMSQNLLGCASHVFNVAAKADLSVVEKSTVKYLTELAWIVVKQRQKWKLMKIHIQIMKMILLHQFDIGFEKLSNKLGGHLKSGKNVRISTN